MKYLLTILEKILIIASKIFKINFFKKFNLIPKEMLKITEEPYLHKIGKIEFLFEKTSCIITFNKKDNLRVTTLIYYTLNTPQGYDPNLEILIDKVKFNWGGRFLEDLELVEDNAYMMAKEIEKNKNKKINITLNYSSKDIFLFNKNLLTNTILSDKEYTLEGEESNDEERKK